MEKFNKALNINLKWKHTGIRAVPGRVAVLTLIFTLALIPGGCLGGNDQAEEARQKRDEYSAALQRLQQANDNLKLEISDTYTSCDLIGNQLTVVAAMNLHDRYTDGLGRRAAPEPIPEPVIADRPKIEREKPTDKTTKASENTGGSKVNASQSENENSPKVPQNPPPKVDFGGGSPDFGDLFSGR